MPPLPGPSVLDRGGWTWVEALPGGEEVAQPPGRTEQSVRSPSLPSLLVTPGGRLPRRSGLAAQLGL